MDSSPCLAWLQQNRLQIYDLKKFAKQDTRRTLPAIDNIFSVHSCQIQQFLCKDEEYVFTFSTQYYLVQTSAMEPSGLQILYLQYYVISQSGDYYTLLSII